MIAYSLLTAASLLVTLITGAIIDTGFDAEDHKRWRHIKRQYFPSEADDVTTITTPTNVTIRYKMPGSEGVCETTPGVNSYSGYVDVSPNVHMFFWFFESRRDPANDDLTLWLNGGPGSDSLFGLFEELGPCRVTPDLETVINPYSWNNVSNLLFLSQPVGVGFSYQDIANGSYANGSSTFLNSTQAPPTGTWPILDPVNEGTIDTTDLAAVSVWQTLQGLLSGLPQLEGNRAEPKNFNLWTQSYGGHYGPSFYNYFQQRNREIKNGTIPGYELSFNTLGLVNPIIDSATQQEAYYEFAVNNTYGIKAYNDTIYEYAKFADLRPSGCQDQIKSCIAAATGFQGGYSGRVSIDASQNPSVAAICSSATNMCRDNVEGMYYAFGDRGVYDIRHPADDPTPPGYYLDYVNQAYVQNAIGVSLNHTSSNTDIYYQFERAGDFIYPNFLTDLVEILDSGVRVVLFYGDADYICNWYGGLEAALALNYTQKEDFAAAEWAALNVSQIQYGETKEAGNFSFVRMYDAGHAPPFYQPLASLAMFERAISGWDLASGREEVTEDFATSGQPNSTHTNSFVPLPATDSAAGASFTSSVRASYDSKIFVPVPTDFPYKI